MERESNLRGEWTPQIHPSNLLNPGSSKSNLPHPLPRKQTSIRRNGPKVALALNLTQ